MYMKSKTREDKVEEFHKAMGLDIGADVRESLVSLRRKLISEEAREVDEALNLMELNCVFGREPDQEDWENLLKELCDLQYVLSGTVVALKKLRNVDFDVAFNRVHESNMSKLDDNGKPVKNEIGKVIKGPNYKPANMKGVI